MKYSALPPALTFSSLLVPLSILAGCGGGGGGSAILSPVKSPAAQQTEITTTSSPSEGNNSVETNTSSYEVLIASPDTPADVDASILADSENEYNMSWGLSAINASALYAQGGTGKGQTVAVVDTGIDGNHSELGNHLLSSSYDFQNDSSVMTDSSNHGTHVAGIIAAEKDGNGSHGVAYEADILGISILGDQYKSFDEIADIYQYAIDHGAKIINNSWGTAGVNIDSYNADSLSAIFADNIIATGANAIAKDDSVFVWSAGNQNGSEVNLMAGLPYHFPELKQGWVAVVAINQGGDIANYSSHCGKAKEWCLAAPGSSIYSSASGGGYMASSGASAATAHVSGGLAALKSAFPNLTNQQILARVLKTANKSGVYANSDIYGNGLLDLEAASSPVGDLKMANTSSASAAALASSSVVVLPKSLLSDVGLDIGNTNVLLFDSFQDAPFWASASQYITSKQAPVLDIQWSSLFSASDNDHTGSTMALGGDLSLSYNLAARSNAIEGFNLKSSNGETVFAFGTGSGKAVGENILSFTHSPDWLNASEDAYLASSYQLQQLGDQDNIRVNLGVASKNKFAESTESSELVKSTAGDVDTAVMAEMAMQLNDSTELSMQLGMGVIDNINSQTSASGAFGLNSSKLSNIGFGVSKQIGSGELTASVDFASITTANNDSLIEMPDRVGLTTAKMDYQLTDGGRHGLKVGAALRRANGDDINIRLPSSVSASGVVGYSAFNADIGSLYDQSALELTYNYIVNKSTTLGVQSFYQQQGDSVEDFGIIFGIEMADR